MIPTNDGRWESVAMLLLTGPTVILLAFSMGNRLTGRINISAGRAEMLSR